jgi:sugar/nucleoside kinase (ribokinase family)
MSNAQFDVTAIGNAIVDVIAQADDAFLDKHKLPKGAMNPHRHRDGRASVRRHGPGKEASGGSAGNTIAGIAALGGRTAYIGKVAKDQLGDVFTHDMRAVGVKYDTAPLVGGLPTARSLIIVTPGRAADMQTVSRRHHAARARGRDMPTSPARRCCISRATSGISRAPRRRCATRPSRRRRPGVKVAFTLSDSFCVARYRAEFLDLVEKHVDILFANEHEILSLYEVENFDDALQKCAATARLRR